MIEVRGGNPDEYEGTVSPRAPTPDNEKKPAAKPIPDNPSAVDEVANPKEAVEEMQQTAAKVDSWGEPFPYQELRAGCVLTYYHPVGVAGDPRFLMVATVLEIKPSPYDAEEFILTNPCNSMNLQDALKDILESDM